MTTIADSAPETARDLVTMPEPARRNAREAREVLTEAGQEAKGEEAGAGLPFSMEAGREAKGRRSRPGGHKPTKAELEAELGAARSQLAQLTGERPPEEAAALEGLRGALGGTFGAVFNFAAASRGEHWRLRQIEQSQLADSWAPVLAPYLASTAHVLPWVTAAGVTYSILEPRLAIEAERAGNQAVEVDATPAPASSSSARPAGPRDPGPTPTDLRSPPDTISDHPGRWPLPASNGESARPLDPPRPTESRGVA